MQEKELKIEINKGIREEISKSALYDKLKDSYEDDSLRMLLASKPSLEDKKK